MIYTIDKCDISDFVDEFGFGFVKVGVEWSSEVSADAEAMDDYIMLTRKWIEFDQVVLVVHEGAAVLYDRSGARDVVTH